MTRKKRIAVTGYEAFGRFAINPAAIVVKNLAQVEFPPDIEVTTELIAVCYDDAEKCSSNLCLSTKPDWIVHVGVAGPFCDTIHLETQSSSHGYWDADVMGDQNKHKRLKQA